MASRRPSHSAHRTGCLRSGTVYRTMPPGRSTLAHSHSTEKGSATYSSTLASTTTSNDADANGSLRQSGSSRTHPALRTGSRASRWRTARRSICGDMSHPVTRRPAAARARASSPVPHPISRTRCPAWAYQLTAAERLTIRPISGPPCAYFAPQPAALASKRRKTSLAWSTVSSPPDGRLVVCRGSAVMIPWLGRRRGWWPACCPASPRSASLGRPARPARRRWRGRDGPCPAALSIALGR